MTPVSNRVFRCKSIKAAATLHFRNVAQLLQCVLVQYTTLVFPTPSRFVRVVMLRQVERRLLELRLRELSNDSLT